jgi:hypothetical protein
MPVATMQVLVLVVALITRKDATAVGACCSNLQSGSAHDSYKVIIYMTVIKNGGVTHMCGVMAPWLGHAMWELRHDPFTASAKVWGCFLRRCSLDSISRPTKSSVLIQGALASFEPQLCCAQQTGAHTFNCGTPKILILYRTQT